MIVFVLVFGKYFGVKAFEMFSLFFFSVLRSIIVTVFLVSLFVCVCFFYWPGNHSWTLFYRKPYFLFNSVVSHEGFIRKSLLPYTVVFVFPVWRRHSTVCCRKTNFRTYWDNGPFSGKRYSLSSLLFCAYPHSPYPCIFVFFARWLPNLFDIGSLLNVTKCL